MKKSSKQLLFERMNSIGGMPLKEEFDVSKDYVDRRTGKSYSGEQVAKWVNWFLKARRISKKERQNALSLFKAMGLDHKEYTKEKFKNTNKLRFKGDQFEYVGEAVFGDYVVRIELSLNEMNREICYQIYVGELKNVDLNDDDWIFTGGAMKTSMDCTEMGINYWRRNADNLANEEIKTYKQKKV